MTTKYPKPKMTTKYPKPGEKYQHYKGGQYEVICMCNHTDTNEPLVVYRSISFGSQYARPFSEWYEQVSTVKIGAYDQPIYRFQSVEEPNYVIHK